MGSDSGNQGRFEWEKWTAVAALVVALISAVAAGLSADASRDSAKVASRALDIDRPELRSESMLADGISTTGLVQFVLTNSGKQAVSVKGVRMAHAGREALVTIVDPTSPVGAEESKAIWGDNIGTEGPPLIPAATIELEPGGVEFLVLSAEVLAAIVVGNGWCAQSADVGFELVTGVGYVELIPPTELFRFLASRCVSG